MVNEAADVANHFCAVAAGKVLFRCRTWRKALQSLAEVFVGFECPQNALQPFFCFEVRLSRVMPEERGVDGDRRPSLEDTPDCGEFGDVDEILTWDGIFCK